MDWQEVQARVPLYLNLGGGRHCHPEPGYENYISVDLRPPEGAWAIQHDLRQPLPLADGSVSRIHCEDFLEHISTPQACALLGECHRLLESGGRMRIGVPDYGNPKDRFCLEMGRDPRDPKHVTLTHYAWMRDLIAASPFTRHRLYHYWDGDEFIREPIDYSLGMIRRTPDNDPRCRRVGTVQLFLGVLRDAGHFVSRGFRVSRLRFLTRSGHPLHVTSLVGDLFKD